jgi:hypothetical protein
MVLLPLRAWASTEVMAAVVLPHAPVSAMHTDKVPPCHAQAEMSHGESGGAEAGGSSHTAACGCCAFCAPVLATIGQTAPGLIVVRDIVRGVPEAMRASGDPEPFFRPPRG